MKTIKILGSGCTKCNKLYELADQAAGELGIDYQMEKVSDIDKFADYGVMVTPALVVDGKVKSTGKLPVLDKLKEYISD
ncbi:MAG: thioredoxin family protein [Proteobacteria bacterium]|nr:thioredoxin family protein [Pseudomonadota bacterium]